MNWNDDRLDGQFKHIDQRCDGMEKRFDRLQNALIVTLGSLVAATLALTAAAQL